MKNYGFRLSEKIIDQIDAIAENREKDRSTLVREILTEWILSQGGIATPTTNLRFKNIEERLDRLEKICT